MLNPRAGALPSREQAEIADARQSEVRPLPPAGARMRLKKLRIEEAKS